MINTMAAVRIDRALKSTLTRVRNDEQAERSVSDAT